MTPDRRAKLREWHRPDEHGMCKQCGTRSFDGDFYVAHWPCHTIEVLDELDKAWKGLDVLADAGLAAMGAAKELLLQTEPVSETSPNLLGET